MNFFQWNISTTNVFHNELFQVVINASTKHENNHSQNIIKLLYPDSVYFQNEAIGYSCCRSSNNPTLISNSK